MAFLSFQFLPSLWFSHGTRTGFMASLSSSIAQLRVILYRPSCGNSLKVWSYLICLLSTKCMLYSKGWDEHFLQRCSLQIYTSPPPPSVSILHITPLVTHLSVFIWAMKCSCITCPWKDRVGEAVYSCKLFQHLGKLYLDYLGKLYLDYLCWMTMICLGTPASPYTWKNKYKLSELLIVGKLFPQYLDK